MRDSFHTERRRTPFTPRNRARGEDDNNEKYLRWVGPSPLAVNYYCWTRSRHASRSRRSPPSRALVSDRLSSDSDTVPDKRCNRFHSSTTVRSRDFGFPQTWPYRRCAYDALQGMKVEKHRPLHHQPARSPPSRYAHLPNPRHLLLVDLEISVMSIRYENFPHVCVA